jgi:uncharacterized protein
MSASLTLPEGGVPVPGFDGPAPGARILPGSLADGNRHHLQHGPIDLILKAEGPKEEVARTYTQAEAAFAPILDTLVQELTMLRAPVEAQTPLPSGPVARRMLQAVTPYTGLFVTPMAAVAGAVADHVLAAMVQNRKLLRAYVNNGGDIAVFLTTGARFRIGVCSNPQTGAAAARLQIGPEDGIAGIATSGWRGRSHSMGIADAVTVLASTAADADAAATMIANAVDLPGSSLVTRVPARTLSPDSDLGYRLVTVGVEKLSDDHKKAALAAGQALAAGLIRTGCIRAAYLNLQGEMAICGDRYLHENSERAELP